MRQNVALQNVALSKAEVNSFLPAVYGSISIVAGIVKTITAEAFKTNCLAVIDEIQTKRESLLITKNGKTVAKLAPVDSDEDDIFGFFAGKARIIGDIIEPAVPLEEWEYLNDEFPALPDQTEPGH